MIIVSYEEGRRKGYIYCLRIFGNYLVYFEIRIWPDDAN